MWVLWSLLLVSGVVGRLTTDDLRNGTELICGIEDIQVKVNETIVFYELGNENLELYLGPNAECTWNGTDTDHIMQNGDGDFIYKFTYPECGSIQQSVAGVLEYKTVIGRRSYVPEGATGLQITRLQRYSLDVNCFYYTNGTVVTTSFQAYDDSVVDDLTGDNVLALQLLPYKYDNYMVPNTDNPIKVGPGKIIWFQIFQNADDSSSMHLVAENCSFHATENPNVEPRVDLIRDRCLLQPRYWAYIADWTDTSRIRFSITATGFVEDQDQTFLTCTVIVCDAGDTESACSQTPVCDGVCGTGMFYCEAGVTEAATENAATDGLCIPDALKCDGVDDCSDGADEAGCPGDRARSRRKAEDKLINVYRYNSREQLTFTRIVGGFDPNNDPGTSEIPAGTLIAGTAAGGAGAVLGAGTMVVVNGPPDACV